MFLLYQHLKLDTEEIFYIGIGNDNRPYDKIVRSKYWKDTVNKHGYKIEILHENLSWELACEIEIYLIKFYGRKDLGLGNLVNMTDGGDGVSNLSDESRNKIKKALKNNNHFLGKTHSEETKNKIRLWNKNKKLSDETKLKMSNSKKEKAKTYNNLNHHFIKNIYLDINTGIFYSTNEILSILNTNVYYLSKKIINTNFILT